MCSRDVIAVAKSVNLLGKKKFLLTNLINDQVDLTILNPVSCSDDSVHEDNSKCISQFIFLRVIILC